MVSSLMEDTATFQIIRRKSGDVHQVLVDSEDYDRVVQLGRWTYHPQGYAFYQRDTSELRLYLHRFVLGLVPGDPLVDHRNGNGLDNRKSNLRLSTKSQNATNQALVNNIGTSKYRGIFWDKTHNRWNAEQVVEGRHHHLGCFRSEDEALAVLTAFRLEHDLGGY